MAVDPHTLKLIAQAVISQITDEEKRQKGQASFFPINFL